MNLMTDRVAVVTGASRGVGKGIAIALGAAGYTVYITGRSVTQSEMKLCGQSLSGTLTETAALIKANGGHCIPIACDHTDDKQVEALFDRVRVEQGRLDLLVNNAIALHENLINPGPFWEKPLEMVTMLDVGLRSSYVASYFAAPLLLQTGNALIVFTSSYGGVCYMHGPAYGAQKAGSDKMAHDMAVDFEGTGVDCVSLWLGPQITERSAIAAVERPDTYGRIMQIGETPEFSGRVILSLFDDPQRAKLSGKTLIGAELAHQYYGIVDDNRQPPSYRDVLGSPQQWHPTHIK